MKLMNWKRFFTYSKTLINNRIILTVICLSLSTMAICDEYMEGLSSDVIKTTIGDVRVTFVGDASVLLQLDTLNIYVDPCSLYVCTRDMPKADLILVTNAKEEHFDKRAIGKLFKHDVRVMGPRKCQNELKYMSVLNNDGWSYFNDIRVEAYHAYNIVKRNDRLEHFNIKWEGNGYVINFGKTRIYFSGDTEVIPEMRFLGKIDVAFVPMNEETMTTEDIIKFIEVVKPKVVYPYHYAPMSADDVKLEFSKYEINTDVRVMDCYPDITLKNYGGCKVLSY